MLPASTPDVRRSDAVACTISADTEIQASRQQAARTILGIQCLDVACHRVDRLLPLSYGSRTHSYGSVGYMGQTSSLEGL